MYPLFRNFLFRKELVFSISFILYTSFVSIAQQNATFCPPFSIGVNHDCEDGNDLPAIDVKLYRTIDGKYNNPYHHDAGANGIPLVRKGGKAYFADDDGNTMLDRGNPRMISNIICEQYESLPNDQELSSLVFTFLQFLDHDITLAEGSDEYKPIDVPMGDPYFDPYNTGNQIIPFSRTEKKAGTGTPDHPRQNINHITAWIDGSAVYGSDQKRAKWLRSGEYGRLKSFQSDHGEILPCNTLTGDCNDPVDPMAPNMAGNKDLCGNDVKIFVAGDIRANEQIGLTAMHTIFLREHNRICDSLRLRGFTEDEWNYQYARKLVGGMIQSITYNEVLPALGIKFGKYKYQPWKKPDIFNEFATAAYRLGHTMITETIPMLDKECNPATVQIGCSKETTGVFGGVDCTHECKSEYYTGSLRLKDAFFNPSIIANNGIESIILGLKSQKQERIDTKVTGSLRNFLFGEPGQGGLDLATLNIQRGRDHGLPSYNEARQLYGMKAVEDFSEISTNEDVQDALASAYGSVDDIDMWIGLISEDHVYGKAIGPSLLRMLKYQFRRIRNADRFYFENDPLISRKHKRIIRETRLADIINRNSEMEITNAFQSGYCYDVPEYCEVSCESSEQEWIEEVFIRDYHNKSGNNDGYGDYKKEVIELRTGIYEAVNLRAGYKHRKYPEYWKIWIDLNHNGEYEAEEIVFKGRRRYKAKGFMYLPKDATLGYTGMRISMSYYNENDPCINIKYGEIEDYTIHLVPSTSSNRVNQDLRPTEDITSEDFSITLTTFPNPTYGKTTVQFYSKYEQAAELKVIHISGIKVAQESLELRQGENYIDINGSQFQAGLYTIFIDFERTGQKSSKLIILRD